VELLLDLRKPEGFAQQPGCWYRLTGVAAHQEHRQIVPDFGGSGYYFCEASRTFTAASACRDGRQFRYASTNSTSRPLHSPSRWTFERRKEKHVPVKDIIDVAEQRRLNDSREAGVPWKKWGPYLSERQWGTVREDYSNDGNAWDYFSHDQSRSRAYHWGEDGLGGISDDKQRLCFALALWNERDPILKERLFGLTNSEANHGEDVKEYYFYIDSTPTHSYMKYLYKYPQREFPYRDLVETNRGRSREEFEYELLDTGMFNEDRYFDVFVEYAKEGPENLLIRITAHNRGPEAANLRLLPTLWFRNTWSWGGRQSKAYAPRSRSGNDPSGSRGIGRILAVLRWAPRAPVHGE
jgi:hypothetical protein